MKKSRTARLFAVCRPKKLANEIIIVDDGSKDGTREILTELNNIGNVRIIFHTENHGKDAAVRTGIQLARSDILIIQDVDLE